MSNGELARVDAPAELSVQDLVQQVQKIQHVMKEVMQENQHYGVIPGTEKPTLLKPGAEKLGLTFRLAPSFSITQRELFGGHREYEIICTLTHITSGAVLGQGVGLCSTMESRYRWRRGEPQSTGKAVPGPYWNTRKADPAKAQELLGGKGFQAHKIDGQWFICKRSDDRVENQDIADTFNTVLKIAKKRAHVDAILTATAASDIFTQDVEDLAGQDSGSTSKEIAHDTNESAQQTNGGDKVNIKQTLWDNLMRHAKDNKQEATKLLKVISGKNFVSNLSNEEATAAQLVFERDYLQVEVKPEA